MLAYSMAARSAAAKGAEAASNRAAGVAGNASTTASASMAVGDAAEPVTSRQPAGNRSTDRTVASHTTCAPAAVIAAVSASARRPTPPARPAKTGPDAAGLRPDRSARNSERWVAITAICGMVARSDSSSARPAYTPPSSGSTSRSTTSPPRRAPTYALTDTSSPTSVAGSTRSRAARTTPTRDTTPHAASPRTSTGTPITWCAGSDRSRPRDQTAAVVVCGWVGTSPRRAMRSRPSGRRASTDSAPRSVSIPAICPRRSRPPADAARSPHLDAARSLPHPRRLWPDRDLQVEPRAVGRNLIATGTRREREDIMAMTNGIKGSRTIAALGVTAALAVLVTGCSGSMRETKSSAAGATTDAQHGLADSGAFAAPAASSAAAAPNPAAPQALLTGRQVIFTADITVRTTDIKAAVGKVSLIATSSGGLVFGEQVSLASKDPSNPGEASATVVLKVPPPALNEGILDQIGRVGTELGRNEHADDVTAQVVDVNSRVAAATDSLTRLRQLFQHAGNVTDLANVENQIAQREADLESLEAQQRAFRGQTAQATITVNLVAAPPVAAIVPPTKKAHIFGFLRGLRGGWHAFTKATSATATAVGALIPFLVVVLILAALGVIVRRRLIATPPTQPVQPTQTPTADPAS